MDDLALSLRRFFDAASPMLRRLTSRSFVLWSLWALFVVWAAYGVHADLGTRFGGRSGITRAYVVILLALDVWSLAAALLFGAAAGNPLAWRNGKRLIFGSLALAMMLGRLLSGDASYFGYILPLLQLPFPTLIIFSTAPVLLLAAGALVIFAIGSTVASAFALFVGVPVLIFNQVFAFEKSLNVYRYRANGLAGYITRAVFWLRNERLPAPAPDDSKGARFATPAEMLAIHNTAAKQPARMGFGHWPQDNAPFFAHTEKHVLIMASTRSGKGVTLIIPHLLRYQGSAFVLDPKGENARATGRQRATFGKVHYLDPFGISGKPRSRFNPLSRFTPENMEAESRALAAAMFVVQDRGRDHWTEAGQQLLAAIILYVFCSPDIPRSSKDLVAVRRILLGNLRPALELMQDMDDGDGLLSDLATSFLATPEKEFGSIVSTAQRQTEILDNPSMAACLSASGPGTEVDFKAWHSGVMTVYLCLAAPKFPTFNRWLRLVLTSALDEMTDRLEPPRLPVCFMLDELATLGHLPAVENAVGLAAGYGIQLVTVFQDVAQMRDLYKGRWASFIGNAGVRALFNLDDFETAEYWSKFIGGRLVESRSAQQDIYGYSQGDNVSESMRPLVSPDKLMMDLSRTDMLVLAQGAHPISSRRVAYWEDQGLKGLWDDPRGPATPAPTQPFPPAPPPASPRGSGPRPVAPSPVPVPPGRPASPVAPAPTTASAYRSGSMISFGGQTALSGARYVRRDPMSLKTIVRPMEQPRMPSGSNAGAAQTAMEQEIAALLGRNS